MKSIKIKSYCKINLYLKIIKKLRNGYHNINSLITFCDLFDLISISEIKDEKNKVFFYGKFKNGINKKKNTVTQTLNLLKKNKFIKNKVYKINIKKNIPHGSGLGGGSSNAADLLNFFALKFNKQKKMKLAAKVGFDVPINLDKKNTFLTGKKNEIIKINKNFGLNLLIVYPNFKCSTKKIYQKNKIISGSKPNLLANIKNKTKLINFLKNEKNDLEKIVVKIYPKVKKILDFIKFQKGCYFSRITGSGSACIGIFSNMKNAISAKRTIKSKYPKYWCAVSKTI